jgi:hypothetical protein
MANLDQKSARTGVAGGMLVAFAIVLALLLALDAGFGTALLVAVGLAIFVGGPIGMLIGVALSERKSAEDGTSS